MATTENIVCFFVIKSADFNNEVWLTTECWTFLSRLRFATTTTTTNGFHITLYDVIITTIIYNDYYYYYYSLSDGTTFFFFTWKTSLLSFSRRILPPSFLLVLRFLRLRRRDLRIRVLLASRLNIPVSSRWFLSSFGGRSTECPGCFRRRLLPSRRGSACE